MARRLKSIDLVNNCDPFPDAERDPDGYAETMGSLYTMVWEDEQGSVPIGYMRRSVLDKLTNTPEDIRGPMRFDETKGSVSLFQGPATEPERTKFVAGLTAYWRERQTFRILHGWRDELWPVYGRNGELLFSIERTAMGIFGNMRYGIHMTAFVRSPESTGGFKIWVPKRSATKSTYPGMLDNTAAGGLMTDEEPFEAIIREADEEASIPEGLMRERLKEVGTVTYIYITDERSGGEPGYIYPECQWVYEMELPEDVTPAPKDGEVQSFRLCTVEEIKEQLAQGLWKPNCAIIILDFFVRHGILTPENEPAYEDIRRRIHRSMPFPGPHQKFHKDVTEVPGRTL